MKNINNINNAYVEISIYILVALILIYILKFNLIIVGVAAVLEHFILKSIVKGMIDKKAVEKRLHYVVTFKIIGIVVFFTCVILIEQGSYYGQISYQRWLLKEWQDSKPILMFELATVTGLFYILNLSMFYHEIRTEITKFIDEYFPPIWSLILGIWLAFWLGKELGHNARLISIGITTGALIITALYHHGNIKNSFKYRVKARKYLFFNMLAIVGIVGLGMSMPSIKNLPGTKWVKLLMSHIQGQADVIDNIPYNKKLSKEVPRSEEVLFTVESNEPIYLRQIAYEKYEDGTWSIPENDQYSFMSFKPMYLEAEYAQFDELLKAMQYINFCDQDALPQYREVFKYEQSIRFPKSFYISQNPRNESNFLTTNGLKNIEMKQDEAIYYYYSLDNIYFHTSKNIEPTDYTVYYYDRVPKKGTKEYMLLKRLNAESWKKLYSAVQDLKKEYHYDESNALKILEIDTPLRQYERTRIHFLQIPQKLKDPITNLTQKVIGDEVSDWGKAQKIETYLKNTGCYKYKLYTPPVPEGKDTIYHFLFEKKEGVCQDFASSMVLMCRSVGLPARYVTGYLATEKNSEGIYEVRAKDAHAFVEVYLAGYGWMQFDPTPPVEENSRSAMTASTEKVSRGEYYVVSIVLFFLMMLIILSKVIGTELYHYIYWNLMTPSKAFEKMMQRLFNHLKQKGYVKKPQETLTQYAERLKDEENVAKLIRYFERYQYGSKEITHEDFKESLKLYKVIHKRMRRK